MEIIMKEYALKNIVSDTEHKFKTEEEFIEFVCNIFDENEECTDEQDKLEKPNNVYTAFGYILNYCDSFQFVKSEPTLIHVCSSCADIYCDENGVVVELIDLGGIEDVENIHQFNFSECDAYWGEALGAYDILDLGGVNKDGTTFAPSYKWRRTIDLRDK